MTIPNILTALRFLLIPVFVYFYVFKDMQYTSAAIIIVSSVTDILDGYIARRFNMKTDLGAVFDPLVDKITQVTVVLCIAINGVAIMWAAFFLMLFKEAAMVFGGIKLYRKKDIVVSANWSGKLATCLFYVVVLVIICFVDVLPRALVNFMVIVTLAASFFAGIVYAYIYFVNGKIVSKQDKRPPASGA